VFDAVYTPRRTRLLKEADAAGATTVGGVEMFLRQAIGQFNIFTGLEGTIFFFSLFTDVLCIIKPFLSFNSFFSC